MVITSPQKIHHFSSFFKVTKILFLENHGVSGDWWWRYISGGLTCFPVGDWIETFGRADNVASKVTLITTRALRLLGKDVGRQIPMVRTLEGMANLRNRYYVPARVQLELLSEGQRPIDDPCACAYVCMWLSRMWSGPKVAASPFTEIPTFFVRNCEWGEDTR